MLMYLFILNLFLSLVFIYLNHPLSLGCILFMQTYLISMMSGSFYYNFWFCYILFLIMIGGMLVMFIYMTSIASNEKFLMPGKFLAISTFIFANILLSMLMKDNFYSYIINSSINSFPFFSNLSNLSLNKFYNHPNLSIMIFLMIYLLLALVAIEKIIDKNLGSLRQK
uniref:NADH-ubiquinone oxidoreductase chain 6 n=1 Tax=Kyklioacalles sp. BMNH 1043787 TaxID=2834675 RepID=A0A8F5A3N5_9CUCU|nr:NADH dehydrogenase subunit 6 [Kyklioacalles sp. BMNH 1043787]